MPVEVALIGFGATLITFALGLLVNTLIGKNRAEVQSIRGDAVDKFSRAASENVDTILKLQERLNDLEQKFDDEIEKRNVIINMLQRRILQLETVIRQHGWPVPTDDEITQPLPKAKGLRK